MGYQGQRSSKSPYRARNEQSGHVTLPDKSVNTDKYREERPFDQAARRAVNRAEVPDLLPGMLLTGYPAATHQAMLHL